MIQYRCYFLDNSGRVFDRKLVECDDRVAALADAAKLLAESEVAGGVEVWEDAYMVQRLKKLGT